MSEQEKTQQRISFAKCRNQTKVSLSTVYKANKKFFTEKELFKEKWELRIEQKIKRRLFIDLTMVIKGPHNTYKKHANELKVHEKTVRTAIKQD